MWKGQLKRFSPLITSHQKNTRNTDCSLHVTYYSTKAGYSNNQGFFCKTFLCLIVSNCLVTRFDEFTRSASPNELQKLFRSSTEQIRQLDLTVFLTLVVQCRNCHRFQLVFLSHKHLQSRNKLLFCPQLLLPIC